MKRFLLTICLLAASMCLAMADDYAVPFEQLPATSREFVNTHFAGVQTAYCLRDSHSFEARLADGAEIEFNLDGSWKEIELNNGLDVDFNSRGQFIKIDD